MVFYDGVIFPAALATGSDALPGGDGLDMGSGEGLDAGSGEGLDAGSGEGLDAGSGDGLDVGAGEGLEFWDDMELVNDLAGDTGTAQTDGLYVRTVVNQLVVTNLLLALVLGCLCTCIFCRYIRG